VNVKTKQEEENRHVCELSEERKKKKKKRERNLRKRSCPYADLRPPKKVKGGQGSTT
jgi:hypothetical protein